jgi:purine-binding chemotaxis protein CheW
MDPEAISAAIEKQHESDTDDRPEPERVSYIGFCLGDEMYGLPLEQLREVARIAQVRRVPGAPEGVAGLVNLRGEILCALDLRAILRLPPQRTSDSPFLIALRGFGDPLGLIVDAIADIYSVSADDIEPPPAAWPAERAACFLGTVRVPAGLMGLLDLARVIEL